MVTRVISTLTGVRSIVTVLISLVTKSHDPLSVSFRTRRKIFIAGHCHAVSNAFCFGSACCFGLGWLGSNTYGLFYAESLPAGIVRSFFFFSPFTCFWKHVPSTFYAFRQQLPPEAQRWKTKSSPVQGEAEVEHRLLRREHGRHPAHPVAEGKSPGAALLLESQTCSASSHSGKESSGQFSPMARAAWSTRQSLASKRSFHLAASVLRVSIS